MIGCSIGRSLIPPARQRKTTDAVDWVLQGRVQGIHHTVLNKLLLLSLDASRALPPNNLTRSPLRRAMPSYARDCLNKHRGHSASSASQGDIHPDINSQIHLVTHSHEHAAKRSAFMSTTLNMCVEGAVFSGLIIQVLFRRYEGSFEHQFYFRGPALRPVGPQHSVSQAGVVWQRPG